MSPRERWLGIVDASNAANSNAVAPLMRRQISGEEYPYNLTGDGSSHNIKHVKMWLKAKLNNITNYSYETYVQYMYIKVLHVSTCIYTN